MTARRLTLKCLMMFRTHVCRINTTPPSTGYGTSRPQARADALEKAEKAGHRIILRGCVHYVLE